MADSIQYVKDIETFVDSSSSPAEQAASVDSIASLLKNDILTLESLVREMEMCLTSTDSIIRARGIMLLAELLTCLASKRLQNDTISSLVGFFTEKLADWRAVRGALVGCLALMRRKGDVGTVGGSEALALAQSYLQNLQVQALGQHDRKLCFELLVCLLDRYPDGVLVLGDVLVYGICEAIDGEKDPECLMLVFHIVEVLGRLLPDPSGPLASFASDVFDILGCYFPIHFTHQRGEDGDVKKEELSRALMLAFASTPYFEPFSIPLLLEKLSSSLPSTKYESLKYLSYCTEKYGADRMAKHVKALWSELKDAICTPPQSVSLSESELLNGMGFQDNEIVTKALLLLQKVILQNNNLFLSLIVGDEDMNRTVNFLHSCKGYNDIPVQDKQKLHAVGRILSVSAKASTDSCNIVFENFFPRLMDALGISAQNLDGNIRADEDNPRSLVHNFGAAYLCVELLDACRALVVGSDELSSTAVSGHETWCDMLYNFSGSLTKTFSSTLVTSLSGSALDAYIHCGVKGMQILATFPGRFSPVSKSNFESILVQFMSIVMLQFNKTSLWKTVLKALFEIGSFIDKFQDSEKAPIFGDIVVEKIVSFISCDDHNMPLLLKVEVIYNIGMSGLICMHRIVQGLDKALSDSLSEVYAHGDVKLAENSISLLECYSSKVLPWFDSIGSSEEVSLRFAVNIWSQIENSKSFSICSQDEKLLSAAMRAMKHSVGSCSEQSQSLIFHKAYCILSSCTFFPVKESISDTTLVKLYSSRVTPDFNSLSIRDKWIISLFASVIMALRPQTLITNVKVIVQFFQTTLLNGHAPAAQALGSIVNKLPIKVNGMDVSEEFSLEEAIEMIFCSTGWSVVNDGHLSRCSATDDCSEIGLKNVNLSIKSSWLLQTNAIVGLAWIGKGLLMRGHEKVKDIIMTFLSCLLSNSNTGILPWRKDPSKASTEQEVLSLMRSAADAFHILSSDSEACLNRRFHATLRPLYKQRLFSIVLPILQSSMLKCDSSISRTMLHRAFAHVVSCTPLTAILSESKKLIPMLIDGLSLLSEDILNKDVAYSVLLVLSGIMTDKNGQEAVVENAHVILRGLIDLISYPHMMLIRETVIQCLIAMSQLPHARIYPMRTQVLLSVSKALDDSKRAVRQEAVRCRQAWASIASRSLHF